MNSCLELVDNHSHGLNEMERFHKEYGRIERSRLQAALAAARFLPDVVYDRAKPTVRRWRM